MAGDKLGGTELFWEDAVVIAIYFVMVLAVGVWSSWRSKRDSVSGYFLASRSMHWIPVGASLFASNIGSGHFIGLTGSGASSGIGIAGFELNAMFVVLILGWFFVPVYMASGVYTMPEYLRKRFGGQRIRIYLSVLALLLYVFTKISADLYAGAIFINQSIKLDLYGSVLALLAIAGVFTVAGGLSAVIWTDFVQTILMLLGALVLSVISISKAGGYSQLVKEFGNVHINESYVGFGANNESCSDVPKNYMSILRSPSDPELPVTGMIFGLTISAIWYWCSDQGAFWGLMVGLVVGLIRFIWEFSYIVPSCASQLPDPRPDIISKVHYLHFGIILFIISCIVTIAVSYATAPIAKIHLHRLLFWNRHSKSVRVEITKKNIISDDQNEEAEMGKINAAFQDGEKTSNPAKKEKNLNNVKNLYSVHIPEPTPKYKEEPDFLKPPKKEVSEIPMWKKMLFFVCGVSSVSSEKYSEEQFSPEEEATSAADGIIEKPIWRRICNANALLLLIISSFIWGYYA